MKDHLNDPQKRLQEIGRLSNMIGRPAYDLQEQQKYQINIRVNETVGPGMFKPDPLLPGVYLANSLTIRAMRADIFVLGDSIDDFASPVSCACGQEIDSQFWKLCPYCARTVKV